VRYLTVKKAKIHKYKKNIYPLRAVTSSTDFYPTGCIIKVKFHYASWFEAGSKLVSPTSFEADSVMEFGFNETLAHSIHNSFISSRIYLWSHPAPAPRCDRVTDTTVLKYSGYVQFPDFPSATVLRLEFSRIQFTRHTATRRNSQFRCVGRCELDENARPR